MFAKSLRNKFNPKLQRSLELQSEIFSEFLQSQQNDASGELTDTLLICNGGTIRAHGFLLQTASPFLQACLASQGENVSFVRKILLPDFSVKEIENLLSLIYKGFINLDSESELIKLQDTLKFFQIFGVDFSNEPEMEGISGSIKVLQLNSIPQDIILRDNSNHVSTTMSTAKNLENDKVKSAKRKKVAKSSKKVTENSFNENSTKSKAICLSNIKTEDSLIIDLSSDDDDNTEASSPQAPQLGSLSEYEDNSGIVELSSDEEDETEMCSRKKLKLVSSTSKTSDAENSDNRSIRKNQQNDFEDESWQAPNYHDKEWFLEQVLRCHKCNKSYENRAQAFACFKTHPDIENGKNYLCYLCFFLYPCMDSLFRHYARHHVDKENGERASCPYCTSSMPFKSVSSHVIIMHMAKAKGKK